MRVLPDRLKVKLMRKMMGFDNVDVAGSRVTTSHITIPTPDGTVPARVYTPDGDNLPIMVYFHGGGWIGGTVDVVENICRAIADRANHIVINVDYGLAPEHKFPAGTRRRLSQPSNTPPVAATSSAATPSRIVVAGDSAGGNFATVCCLLAHQRGGPAISHQVLIYPGVDMSGAHQDEHGPQEGPHRRRTSATS